MERPVLGLLIAAVCVEAVFSQPLPGWVARRPVVPGYFVGIGIARTEDDLPTARKAATQEALNDIALQVEARVFSQSRLKVAEGGEGMNQEYRSEISTQTAEELQGVEIAGTYEDGEHCWVYARLSVEEFQRRRQEKAAQARQGALALFTQAQGKEPAAALALYLRALGPLQQGAGDPLNVEYRGVPLALATEIPLRIQQLLSVLRLEAAPGGIRLKQRASVDQVLEVRAFFSEGAGQDGPAAGLPLCWRFVRGEGQVLPTALTDKEGVARSRVRQVRDPDRHQMIEARLDLPAFLPPDNRRALEPMLAGFSPPSVNIPLQVTPQLICVTSQETNMGSAVSCLNSVVRGYLEQRGQGLVETPDQADLVVAISARVRQGAQWKELYFVYLDLELAVRDRATGEEIYTAILKDIKGAGQDYEQAGHRVYAKAGQQLEARVLAGLLDQLNR